MMMKLHCISEHEYNELIFSLVFRNNQLNCTLSVSPLGRPTIGYGFNLQDDRTLLPVLQSLEFDVYSQELQSDASQAELYYIDLIRGVFHDANSSRDAEALNNAVQSILAARLTDKRYPNWHHHKHHSQLQFDDMKAVRRCVKTVARNYEKTVDRWLMAFDMDIAKQNPQLFARKSRERAVLFSLAYQGVIGLKPNKTPLFPALGNAFLLDNRALVWYYIRYCAFLQDDKPLETVMQRYYESELFGLYDADVCGGEIATAHCREVFSMYYEYKQHILDHERRYGAMIDEANALFALAGNNAIQTLEQSFSIAHNHMNNTRTVRPQPRQEPPISADPICTSPDSRLSITQYG